MDRSAPFLKCYPADTRTSWIAIQVLIAVGILFGAAFGLKTYAATLDPSEALAEFLGASMVAFSLVVLGVGFVACSLRPVVFSRDGVRRWPFTRFSWTEIEAYELQEFGNWGFGCRLILHTSSDAYPVDFARWGFALRSSESSQVRAIMLRMGVPDRAPVSSSDWTGHTHSPPAAPPMKRHALASSPAQRETKGVAGKAGTTSGRSESEILLHLGAASRPYRWTAMGVILATAVGLIAVWRRKESPSTPAHRRSSTFPLDTPPRFAVSAMTTRRPSQRRCLARPDRSSRRR